MGVDKGTDGADRGLHALDPFSWNSIRTSIVEGGDDVPLEQVIQGLRFDLVLIIEVVVALAFADGPADAHKVARAAPNFVPPAVQRAQVQHAVGRSLHPAGSAGFLGTKW